MREYETVYIAHPDLAEAQIDQLNDRLKSIVERNQGTFFFARSMGKRKLAYIINRQNKGAYYCLDYAAGGNTVAELERALRLDENVMRFLTVMRSEKVDPEARAAEIAARGEAAPVAEQAEERGGEAQRVFGSEKKEEEREEKDEGEE